MAKRKYNLTEQKLIIELHNSSENGINLRASKDKRKSLFESPIFAAPQQTKLF